MKSIDSGHHWPVATGDLTTSGGFVDGSMFTTSLANNATNYFAASEL